MATLVLGAVGTLVGGPIGGSVGALIGQQIDREIFKPTVQGPRLKNLDVQTSHYGRVIPAIFGRMRVSGTVIWGTDIVERKKKKGGGKGKPTTVTYSYRVSFAVALSSRPALRVERIWADGKLIRDADRTDLSSGGTVRFHKGEGGQMPDPLIEAAEGAGQVPACRGLCYCVFEDMQLGDFGNRIPSLTFELVADEEEIGAAEICEHFAPGAIVVDEGSRLTGYAADSDDLESLLGDLMAIDRLLCRREEGHLRLAAPDAQAMVALSADAVAALDGETLERPRVEREGEKTEGETIELRFYDIARDYQIGLQASETIGGDRTLRRFDLPVAIGADKARAIARALAAHRRTAESHLTIALAEEEAGHLAPGDLVTLANRAGEWLIGETEYMPGVLRLSCSAWQRPVGAGPAGAGSRFDGGALADPGETRFMALDLSAVPPFDDGQTMISLLAAGTEPGWRGEAITIEQQGVHQPLGEVEPGAVMGDLIAPLAPSTTLLRDTDSAIFLRLLHDDMELEGAGDAALALGANLLWLDGEIVQFAAAERLGPTDWRLTGLHRGLFGSIAEAEAAHDVGSRALLLSSDMPVAGYDVRAAERGHQLVFAAESQGDDAPVGVTVSVEKRGLVPFAPVHFRARREGGEMRFSWRCRPRRYAPWEDGVDMPFAETREAYRIAAPGGAAPLVETDAPAAGLPLDTLRALAGGADVLTLELRQVGDFALSLPARVDLPAAILAA